MRQLLGLFGQDQLGGGVIENPPLAHQPFEEALERGEQDVLRAEGQRLTIGFAGVSELALIALQDRAGDLGGLVQVTLGTPGAEAT